MKMITMTIVRILIIMVIVTIVILQELVIIMTTMIVITCFLQYGACSCQNTWEIPRKTRTLIGSLCTELR